MLGLLSHCDLDGAASSILVNYMYKPKHRRNCHYDKIQDCLKELADEGCTDLITCDLNFTLDDMKCALELFDNVDYWDHHPSSSKYIKAPFCNIDKLTAHYADDLSNTGLLYTHMVVNRYPGHSKFTKLAMLTDVYDLWKKGDRHWQDAFNLNMIYWDYGLESFIDMFKDGFDIFNAEELKYIESQNQARQKCMYNAVVEPYGKNSAVIFIDNSAFRNEVLDYFSYDTVIIFSDVEWSEVPTCSIRSKDLTNSKLDVILPQIVEEFDIVLNGGGHALAAGISFSKDASFEDIINSGIFETIIERNESNGE